MTFLPLNHVRVHHNYAGKQWQDFTGDLSSVQATLRELGGANTATLSFYNATMDPSQSSGTRVIKKGDKVRIWAHNASGVRRKMTTLKVTKVGLDIDPTKPAGRTNRVTVELIGVGIAGVSGTGSASGVATTEELSNTVTGAQYQIDGDDFAFTHVYAWSGTAHASTSTDTPLNTDETRTNLITNPSFETNTTSWSGTGSATIAQSAVHAFVGTKALLVTWPTAAAQSPRGSYAASGLTVGDTYAFSAYVYVPTGNPDVCLATGFGAFGASTSVKDAWVPLSLVFVATGTSNGVQLTTAGASTSGQVAYLDAALLEHTDTVEDYFDGDTADTGGTGITSPTDGTLLRTNLVLNPSFGTNTTGWAGGTGTTITRLTAGGLFGAECLLLSRTATSASATYGLTGLTSGQTYTVSAYGETAISGGTFKVTVVTDGTAVTPAGVYTRATKTFVATGTTQTVTFTFTASTSQTWLAEIDGVMCEKAPTASTYLDGATTDTGNREYAWTGTANASTSTESATYTEITDNDTAVDLDQIVLTRDSNPGVYGYEDPEGTVQVFDSATKRTGSATLTIGPSNYSSIDESFDMSHIINVLDVRRIYKIKVGKKGSKKEAIGFIFEDSASIAKYGRFKKTHIIHGAVDFDMGGYADAVFAKNADPDQVPTSVTVPIRTASDLLAGYEDGAFVANKVNIVLPDGVTTIGCRIAKIQHQITPTSWAVQVFLRNQHVVQPARQRNLTTDVANNPDGTVYGEHLADDVDATGKSISNGQWVSDSAVGDGATPGIKIENDSSGGVIKFYSGVAGEDPAYINPKANGSTPSVVFFSGDAAASTGTVKMTLDGGSGVAKFVGDGPIDLTGMLFCELPQVQGGISLLSGNIVGPGNVTGQKLFATGPDSQTGSASLRFNGSNQVVTATSLSRFKLEQKAVTAEQVENLLRLEPKTWFDRSEVEENGGSTEGLRRKVGLIAEEVEALAPVLAEYDSNGDLQRVAYDAIGALLIPIVADMQRRIAALEAH